MPGKPGGAPAVPEDATLAQRLALQIWGGTGGFLGGRATQIPVSKSAAYYMGKDNMGRSMYRVEFTANGVRRSQVVSWDGRTIRPPVLKATARPGGIGEPDMPAGGSVSPMPRIKDNALAWLASNSTKLAASDVTALTRAIRDWSGTDPQDFNRWWTMTRNNLPALTGVAVQDFSYDDKS